MNQAASLARRAILGVIALGAAGIGLVQDDARWSGPVIAMADFAYLAWPVVQIGLLIAAVAVVLGSGQQPHAAVMTPLTGTLVLLAAVQAMHSWVLLDIALMLGAFGFLWRAHHELRRHRETITWKARLALATPLGLAAGWLTLTIASAIAEAIWSLTDAPESSLATAWQAGLLVATLFFIGFGIEQSQAHPAYVVGALWGLAAIAAGASNAEETTLMTVSIIVALLTVALFFIERAMFRFRARP